jgi:hypothetical protein
MCRLLYVIASYAGDDHGSNREFAAGVLNTQMIQLMIALRGKRGQGIPNLIADVVIVCPRPRGAVFENYYRWTEWRTILKPYGVSVFRLPYNGKNIHFSYDQWIQAYVAYPNYDYYLFNEDDYYLTSPRSDMYLVNEYRRKFPDDIGYLCQYVIEECGHGYHAATSNGLISRQTFEKVSTTPKDILDSFYNHPYQDAQVRFSRLFLEANIPIKDIRDRYSVVHWASNLDYAIDFTRPECEGSETVFMPVQAILDPNIEIRLATTINA